MRDPKWAYAYAHEVDTKPRDDTRAAAMPHPKWGFLYARDFDAPWRTGRVSAEELDRLFARFLEHYGEHAEERQGYYSVGELGGPSWRRGRVKGGRFFALD